MQMVRTLITCLLLFVAACQPTPLPSTVAEEDGGLCGHWKTVPWEMTFAADGRKLYVTDSEADRVLVVDPRKERTEHTIDTSGKTFGITASSDGTKVFVVTSSPSGGIVSIIDTRSDLVVNQLTLHLKYPQEIALSENDTEAFVSSSQPLKIEVVPLRDGRKPSRYVPYRNYISVGHHLTLLSEHVEAGSYSPFLTNGLSLSFNNSLFVDLRRTGEITFMSTSGQNSPITIAVQGKPEWALFSPDGTRTFVKVNPLPSIPGEEEKRTFPSLLIINNLTHRVDATVLINGEIGRGVVSPDNRFLYVVTEKQIRNDNNRLLIEMVVSVIDPNIGKIDSEIPLPVPYESSVNEPCSEN